MACYNVVGADNFSVSGVNITNKLADEFENRTFHIGIIVVTTFFVRTFFRDTQTVNRFTLNVRFFEYHDIVNCCETLLNLFYFSNRTN